MAIKALFVILDARKLNQWETWMFFGERNLDPCYTLRIDTKDLIHYGCVGIKVGEIEFKSPRVIELILVASLIFNAIGNFLSTTGLLMIGEYFMLLFDEIRRIRDIIGLADQCFEGHVFWNCSLLRLEDGVTGE